MKTKFSKACKTLLLCCTFLSFGSLSLAAGNATNFENFSKADQNNSCGASAGTLTSYATDACLLNNSFTFAVLTAQLDGNTVIPGSFTKTYVLTEGDNLVIKQVKDRPQFLVNEPGEYTIHTLVYNPLTLDLSIVQINETTGFDVFALLIDGGGDICASLDVAGASISVAQPNAGTLTANETNVNLVDGSAQISATPDGNSAVQVGYETLFVLTKGEGLAIQQAQPTPEFTVTTEGNFTIHTLIFNPETLDLSIVVPGVTTGFDVNGLLFQGGGSICGSLDVAGAPVTVTGNGNEECNASAGTLTADSSTVCFDNQNGTTISATPNGNAIVPDGFSTVFVLTQGADLIIQQAGASPEFAVEEDGDYRIHTLVFDPETLDLSVVVPGVTTGFDVFGLLIDGGGDICASLDVPGAAITIENPNAGGITANASEVSLTNGTATIAATPNGDSNTPNGYSTIFVLTEGDGLVIQQAGATPEFTVTATGNYIIHTLVYNPETLNLGIVEPGVTTGFDVFSFLVEGGGSICASLDVAGAPIIVTGTEECVADAGTLSINFSGSACLVDDPFSFVILSAQPDGNELIPAGFIKGYVLTRGEELIIQNVNSAPQFLVNEPGEYTIHTLVYDSETLDLGIVELGVTTGFDVFGLLIDGGGDICASLDVPGASFSVIRPEAGTLTATNDSVILESGSATISATPDGNSEVPNGYSTIFVLTEGNGLVIQQAGDSPEFTVTETGFYTIHSLVFNPETLDLSLIVPGETTGFDVFGLLVEGGGPICASLDVAGAPIVVTDGNNVECTVFSGTYESQMPLSCISNDGALIEATVVEQPIVPDGFEQIFVLTEAFTLTILDVAASPEFTVFDTGFYRIHSLVYDPNTLDLGIVVPGETTGLDVAGLLQENGGPICASLDVDGALNLVLPEFICNIIFGRTTEDLVDDIVSDIEQYASVYRGYVAVEKDIIKRLFPIKTYPNPAVDQLTIQAKLIDQEVMNYTLTDLNGRVIFQGEMDEETVVRFNTLNNGIYLLNLTSKERTMTKKIVVSK